MTGTEIRIFAVDPGGTTGYCYGRVLGGHFDLEGYGECELALFELERLSCQIAEWLGVDGGDGEVADVLSVVGSDVRGKRAAGSRGSDGVLGAGSGSQMASSAGNWLVVEDFVLYPGARPGGTKFGGLAPVYVIGVLDGFLWDLGCGSLCSTGPRRRSSLAAAAKGVITDKRLRAGGLWVRGSAHVRDAIRHAELLSRTL